jgi:galactose mutarotase-like enzyme
LYFDVRGIPNGDEESFEGFSGELGENCFDDSFALLQERTSFSVAGAAYTIGVDFLEGYPYTQVFAPKDQDYIALEPMTAPTSALTSGQALRLVEADEQFRAAFRIQIN